MEASVSSPINQGRRACLIVHGKQEALNRQRPSLNAGFKEHLLRRGLKKGTETRAFPFGVDRGGGCGPGMGSEVQDCPLIKHPLGATLL